MSSSGTCDNCHSTQKFASAKLRVIPDYAVDEIEYPIADSIDDVVGGATGHGKMKPVKSVSAKVPTISSRTYAR